MSAYELGLGMFMLPIYLVLMVVGIVFLVRFFQMASNIEAIYGILRQVSAKSRPTPPAAKVEQYKDGVAWVCPKCRHQNQGEWYRCEECGVDKPGV